MKDPKNVWLSAQVYIPESFIDNLILHYTVQNFITGSLILNDSHVWQIILREIPIEVFAWKGATKPYQP